ncbi:cation efflux family-domain-containing protein [Mucor mucedo]|uniref:cation efflux family-domain-containing protein n=1 Tax=Mucor mucedo TaxID=29922 RepID=UPI00221EBD45|nr:cation efflux family-domain-containing protein [Mucor mucedo]KAI7895201.1 cation efflux family-domain-containing protein [Mucor mucedo]
MHQTRQFTKRRPQSPLTTQQNSIDALQIGGNKLPRSGLAIQSNAPTHIAQRSTPIRTEVHEHHQAAVTNPYAPAQHKKLDDGHGHQHAAPDYGFKQVHHDHNQHVGHDHSGHDHSGHSHAGHDHSNHAGHDHSGHNHASVHSHTMHDHSGHSHDHSGHNHVGHNHAGHNHAGHSHAGHDHGAHNHDHGAHSHDHSGHSHASFPQVYTPPLPSYSSILASLGPHQQVLFTCFLGHFAIGIIVWWLGASRESLGVVGFSYLVLFDAFGILNNLVSNVLEMNPAFNTSSTKRPFGVKRFELVFALANTIFLLFGTMYTSKESLEHLLLEVHGDHHGKSSYPFGLLLMVSIAMGASVVSNIKLKNHENLVNLRSRSNNGEYSYNDMKSEGGLESVKSNIYSLSVVCTGGIVFMVHLLGIGSPTLDKMMAMGESALMLYLGGPTAAALAKVLLQTMPDSLQSRVDNNLRMVQQNPNVVSIDKVHFWQNSYGKCIGTAEIVVRPEANEDAVLENSFHLLENLVKDSDGELTISVTKRE